MFKCRKICPTEIDEIVRYLPHRKKNKFRLPLKLSLYCADRAQNLPGPAPTFGLLGSKFHPNRFTFGGVIAESVLLAHIVFGRITIWCHNLCRSTNSINEVRCDHYTTVRHCPVLHSTARRYASAVDDIVVCPSVSVCLSVTSRHCTKTAKRETTITTPYDSPGTVDFSCQKSRRNSNASPHTGAQNRGGVGSSWRLSTNISLYLRTVQDRDIVTMER